MMLARIISPVLTLGPGRRTAVWVCGCKRKCPGCANPELWDYDISKDIPAMHAAQLICAAMDQSDIDGITVTGGEPFDQPDELCVLLKALREICTDILVYTGYTLPELTAMNNQSVNDALLHIAVLIDGPYEEERNNGAALRGSDNQNINILDESFSDKYQAQAGININEIQNIPADGGIISVGIHKKEFRQVLSEGLAGFGLESKQEPEEK